MLNNVSWETTLGEVLDTPVLKKVLDKYLPGLEKNPMVAMARGMTLARIRDTVPLGDIADKFDDIMDEMKKALAK